MSAKNRFWLILEKSDETRVSIGRGIYNDKTGRIYNYDSLVPNFKNINCNDFIIIRKDSDILGYGRIIEIVEYEKIKEHKRCPQCLVTDTRKRKRIIKPWKCGSCKHEFDLPHETKMNVTGFDAIIANFNKFKKTFIVNQIKECSLKGNGLKSQHSILELDSEKLRDLLTTEYFDEITK